MPRYIKLDGVVTTDLTAPRALTTYAFDDFNRADGPLTGKTPVGNKTWELLYGDKLFIAGNQLAAQGITNPSNAQAFGAKAVVETGVTDVELSATLVAGYNNMGLLFRMGADWAGYRVQGNGPNQTEIIKLTAAGGSSVVQAWSGYGITAGMVIKVVCSGDNISVYRDGKLLGTAVDATYKGTKHGACLSSDFNRIDNLRITSLTY